MLPAPAETDLDARYARYSAAVRGEPLPCALVDLDVLERNVARVMAPVSAHGKTIRVATKSVRSLELLRLIAAVGASTVRGLMAYSAAEAAFLVSRGWDDLLIAYPTLQPRDAERIAVANAGGAVVRAVADAEAHLAVLEAAALAANTTVPVVVDVDLANRVLGAYIGVRRSPLHEVAEVVAFVHGIRRRPRLAFAGLLGYEAQVAGLGDRASPGAGPGSVIEHALIAGMKRLARRPIADRRGAIVAALAKDGISVPLFNGGGTGSLGWTAAEASVTEVAAGSGFLASHLFDQYRDLALEPAACFALQVVRRPAAGFVTCLGGGLVASGAGGVDRLPVPYLPHGLRLTSAEGAGEVQTPLRVPAGLELALGSPVFFRHAKAGELAEHFCEYLLVRGDRVVGRARTYRGEGETFL